VYQQQNLRIIEYVNLTDELNYPEPFDYDFVFAQDKLSRRGAGVMQINTWEEI